VQASGLPPRCRDSSGAVSPVDTPINGSEDGLYCSPQHGSGHHFFKLLETLTVVSHRLHQSNKRLSLKHQPSPWPSPLVVSDPVRAA